MPIAPWLTAEQWREAGTLPSWAKPDPFGGLGPTPLGSPMAAGVRAAAGQGRARTWALEQVLSWLDRRVPGWRKIPDPDEIEIALTPRRNLPKTDQYMIPADLAPPRVWSGREAALPRTMRLGAEDVMRRPVPQTASSVYHEVTHVPVERMAAQNLDELKRLAEVARRELPNAELRRIFQRYKGGTRTELAEELVTTLLEHRAAWRHLGFPPGQSVNYPAGVMPPPWWRIK